jgi:hypothetical protein
MDSATVKKWVIFFLGILCAILIADALSNIIVAAAGLTGPAEFIISFVLYAIIFFGVLYVIEKVTGTTFFGFSYD